MTASNQFKDKLKQEKNFIIQRIELKFENISLGFLPCSLNGKK